MLAERLCNATEGVGGILSGAGSTVPTAADDFLAFEEGLESGLTGGEETTVTDSLALGFFQGWAKCVLQTQTLSPESPERGKTVAQGEVTQGEACRHLPILLPCNKAHIQLVFVVVLPVPRPEYLQDAQAPVAEH